MIEDRGGRYVQGPDGKMQGSLPEGGNSAGSGGPKGSLLNKKNLDAYMEPQKTKYAKSPKRSKKGVKISPKKYARLCGTLGTYHPNSKEGQKYRLRDDKFSYHVTADGYGGFTVDRAYPLSHERRK